MKKHLITSLIAYLFIVTIAKAQQPNIVWIVSEDNSKHYMKLFDPNGVETPNIESLAKEGVVFDKAFSNAAVCSAARSTLITSTYGPKLATHYHRAEGKITLDENQEMFPAYLRKAGYYTTNNAKEDYNVIKATDVWDDSSNKSTWRNRKEGQPFFHVFNIGTTHEGRLHFSEEDMKNIKTSTDPATVFVQPNHPQTELFKYTNAFYRDKIQQMDGEVGAVIAQLKEDDLLDDTIIFYYGDHGGVLPFSKGYLTETGLHVPLVVYVPKKYQNLSVFKPGSRTDSFVSFVDFGATVLNIAGIDVPKAMDGVPFLGEDVSLKAVEKRDETYGYADRFDEKYDMVRSYRKGNLKYVRNFQPYNVNGLMNGYRYKQMAYVEWQELFKQGKLNEVQSQFFQSKQVEELYDVEKDPYETNNLAQNPAYHKSLLSMRKNLNSWMGNLPDLSFYPEYYLLQNAADNSIEFGKTHKKDIKKYVQVSNLALLDFEKAAPKIKKYLVSNDPWERYWAINVCCSFGEKAISFSEELREVMTSDTELINKVRAAEFFGLVKTEDTSKVITNALYNSNDGTEALLILNAVVLLRDYYDFSFNFELVKMKEEVKNNSQVKRRLDYLGIL